MADTYKVLYQGLLSNVVATLYTAPVSGGSAIIRHVSLVNTSGSDATARLNVNGTGTSNIWLPVTTLLATVGFGNWDGSLELGAGVTITGVSGTNNVIACLIAGLEMT